MRFGDENAFKTIFEKYYHQLVSYGESISGSKEASRGHVQDVFLKLWESRDQISIKTSLKAYLFTAIYHKALNWRRHEKVKRAYEDDRLKDITEGVQTQPGINPFLQKAISNAIDSLPAKALEVFTLTQLEGLSNKEAATKLGISIKTVENQVTRARKILQKKLKKYL